MVNFTEFDIVVFLLATGIVIFLGRKKMADSKKYEVSTLLTLIAYRATTFLFLALGGSFPGNAYINDRFDHKWLGASLVLVVLLLWPRKKWPNYRQIILGLGTGMLIDEISEILSLFGVRFPPAFRDSLQDLILIIATFVVFITLRRIIEKLRK